MTSPFCHVYIFILLFFKPDLLSFRSPHGRGAEAAPAAENIMGSGGRMVAFIHSGLFPVKHDEDHEGQRGRWTLRWGTSLVHDMLTITCKSGRREGELKQTCCIRRAARPNGTAERTVNQQGTQCVRMTWVTASMEVCAASPWIRSVCGAVVFRNPETKTTTSPPATLNKLHPEWTWIA